MLFTHSAEAILKADLASLESLAAVQDIKSELAQNQNTRATLQATLTEVQNTVATLKPNAAALESLKTDLTQVRGAGDNLRDTTLAAIQDIKSELAQNQNTRATLQATLTEVQNTVATLKPDAAALESLKTDSDPGPGRR